MSGKLWIKEFAGQSEVSTYLFEKGGDAIHS
jgi:hypothetical protein